MRKFRILLVDNETGHDIYNKFEILATSFAEVVTRLEDSGVNFRLVEDVTKYYLLGGFINSPWGSLPACCFRKSRNG